MIEYKVNHPISVDEFIDVLKRSTLGERRPVDNYACMEGMVKNANLSITAWQGSKIVGIARSITDFHFACYLSDLAVDSAYQRSGIGKALIAHTQKQLGPYCWLTLISAPSVQDYYPKIGFEKNQNCWELSPRREADF